MKLIALLLVPYTIVLNIAKFVMSLVLIILAGLVVFDLLMFPYREYQFRQARSMQRKRA